MHLALPTRKSSNPPQFKPRTSRLPTFRRSRAQTAALFALSVGLVIFILSKVSGGSNGIPAGTPPVVIVTVLDPTGHTQQYIKNIQDNRLEYAKRHGYATFFPRVTDYDLGESPKSWTRIPAVRHALTKFPHSKYFWYLEQDALIMNPDLTVEENIMQPKKLDALMIRNQPIVPPDSVIKTYPHVRSEDVNFVLTQDNEGLAPGNFIIKSGDWSKFFLDTWFDPLYRSYNFQKAEAHALEHIVQWHPTILSKLALMPQRSFNAYSKRSYPDELGAYKDGDLVIRFAGCEKRGLHSCETEAEPFSKQWQTVFHARR